MSTPPPNIAKPKSFGSKPTGVHAQINHPKQEPWLEGTKDSALYLRANEHTNSRDRANEAVAARPKRSER